MKNVLNTMPIHLSINRRKSRLVKLKAHGISEQEAMGNVNLKLALWMAAQKKSRQVAYILHKSYSILQRNEVNWRCECLVTYELNCGIA